MESIYEGLYWGSSQIYHQNLEGRGQHRLSQDRAGAVEGSGWHLKTQGTSIGNKESGGNVDSFKILVPLRPG